MEADKRFEIQVGVKAWLGYVRPRPVFTGRHTVRRDSSGEASH